jgi:phage repressor protein C with HTH and peptisase S24 domain
MASSLSSRLKKAMTEQRLSATELAKAADEKPSFIYDILNEKSVNPSPTRLGRIAESLGLSLEYLAGLETSPKGRLKPTGEGYVEISSILIAASAGAGTAVVEEKQGEPYYFRRSWVRDRLGAKPEDLRMIFVEGDSMEPTLCSGDMILVDITKTNPTPPGIFVLFDGLGLVSKRLEFISHSNPPSIRITSDNPQYQPYERHLAEATIIGRVVWFAREI